MESIMFLFFRYMVFGIVLCYVLEVLRKLFGLKMYMFGIVGFDRFKIRYIILDFFNFSSG